MEDRLLAQWTRRHRLPELMDQPGLAPEVHGKALRGLRRINLISRSAKILWPSLLEMTRRISGPVRVLDLACGGGDVPIQLAGWAKRSAIDLRFDGCDISSIAIEIARDNARHSKVTMDFFLLNALEETIPNKYDVVMCSLFLHHLGDDDAIRLLTKMAEATGTLILINDLLRSRVGYGLAWMGCRLLSRSPIVHFDGPASVNSAFNYGEAKELASRAGLDGARLSRHWPCRFLLSWSR